MKRAIALSDAHGDIRSLTEAIEQAQRAGKVDAAVFLGDGVNEFERVRPLLEEKGTQCYVVCGNNDWGCREMQEVTFTVGGVRFFACHGHTRYVKFGLDRLYLAALEREAQVALYGHTHIAHIDSERSIYMINPGAVCERRSHSAAYAEIIVEDNGWVRAQLVKWAS